MIQSNNGAARRVRNLIIICTLIAIVLSVSTYAWFIGMRTVNVNSFDVEIASTDSLLLSLDGITWSQSVAISEANYDVATYPNNTNNWAGADTGAGLFPVSSIGAMDATASRMKLFEKASLTASPGGYRLMASRVLNYNTSGEPATLEPERDGYVVFDLFVKNFSGTQYIEGLEPKDEEAIYLTNDSKVTVASTGVANTGIENSVRVAFAQIGRVIGTESDEDIITGITCTNDAPNGVTGICRTAQIWEPNDTDHVSNAISWYETSCIARTGEDVRDEDSFSGTCGQVIDGLAYPTYAVNDDIASSDNVDIYDGPAYNKYTIAEPGVSLLTPYGYFTDTMKLLTSVNRPTFMTFAPNSITKVRVYIYIEGQDVDNYDFASIGKRIAVQFGFTKERYTEDDINYPNGVDDIDLNQGLGPNGEDLTPPVITLLGAPSPESVTVGSGPYADPGANASDNIDGVVTDDITAHGTVNTDVIGQYKITYTVVDAAGNTATKTRIIEVVAE